MNRSAFYTMTLVIILLISAGCSSGGGSPVSPDPQTGITSHNPAQSTNTHLLGFYEFYIDEESMTAEVVTHRSAMFTLNVVHFLNTIEPPGIGTEIYKLIYSPGFADVDIDVTIGHPFEDMPQFDGYDVRGIFIGDGGPSLAHNPDLIYPIHGEHQMVFPDPEDGMGGPDGYTRWYNPSEFMLSLNPLFSYVEANESSPNYYGSATLCPYKYYASGLEVTDNLWDWVTENSELHGVTYSGASNTRNYYIRFQTSTIGLKFNYAITANWGGVQPENHPSNAPEAVACTADYIGNLYYLDEGH